jgi:hypothetical protein
MRQVILQMSVTLDGYVAGAGGEGDWGLPPEHQGQRDIRGDWPSGGAAPR